MSSKTPQKQVNSAAKVDDVDLIAIVARINARETEIQGLMGKTLNLACLIGRDLCTAKDNIPNGSFMVWVKVNCSLSQQQINRYMRVFLAYPEYVDPEKCPVLSINTALEMLNAPADVRELVKEAIADGEVVHQRTVRELIGKPSYPDNRLTGKPAPGVANPAEKMARPNFYRITNHLCVVCFGRLLIRRLPGRNAKYEVICADCDDLSVISNESLDMPCWCNKTLGDPHVGGYVPSVKPTRKAKDKIFECVINQNDQIPNTVVVREKPFEFKPPEIRPSRAVFVPNPHECA